MGIESSLEKINEKLQKYKNFTDYIKKLNLSINNDLSSDFKKTKKIIEIKEYPNPTKDDDIYICLIQYKLISEKSYGHIKFDNKVWIDLFSYKKYSLKQFLLIMKIIKKILKEKGDIDEFNKYFYNYGKNQFIDIILNEMKMIEKKEERRRLIENEYFYEYLNFNRNEDENQEYKGKDILKYIKNFGMIYRNDKTFILKLCEIIKYINYEEIDYPFQNQFFFSDFPYIFGSHYHIFIFNFLSKINTIENFKHFLNFFNLYHYQRNRIDDELLGFYKIFLNNMCNFYLYNENEFIDVLLFLIKLLKINSIDKTNDIIINLEKKFKNNDVIKILAGILNNINDLIKSYDFFKIYIINYFLNHYKQNKNFDYLCKILENIQKNDILNLMFNNMFDFNISFEEFYSPINNEIIDLIYKITKTKFYQNEEYVNINKIQTIKSFINTFTYEIKNNNITFEQGLIINSLSDQQIKKRFIILYNGNEVSCNSKLRFFRNKIRDYLNYKERLTEVFNFLNTFGKEKFSKNIKDYQEKLNTFLTVKLNNNLFIEEDENFEYYYDLSQKYNIFINSKSFLGIYELEKKKKKGKLFQKLDNTFEKFQTLKQFLTQGKIILKDVLEGIIILINNLTDDIDNEIIFLKNYFNLENIHKDVRLIFENSVKKKTLEQPINNLIQLIDDFQVHNTELYSILDKQKKRFEYSKNQNFSKEMLENIKIELQNLQLEIFKSNSSLKILERMYYRIDNHIKFLIESKTELIDQLYEYIADTNITAKDLNSFKTCCKFVQNISIHKDINDKELLKVFQTVSESSNLDLILDSFENISLKYEDIKDLYKIHFDSNTKKREDIISLYKKSIFYLIFNIPKYNCFVDYGRIKNASFDDILDLRDEALLRRGNEIDDIFIQQIDIFAENVKIINDIINFLGLISLKGSIEDSNYKIIIINGRGKALKEGSQNEKSIEILIQELKTFYYTQNQILKEIYLKFPLLRLINGRIFNKIYNAIKKKRYEDLIYINKYLTNNKCDIKPNFSKIKSI